MSRDSWRDTVAKSPPCSPFGPPQVDVSFVKASAAKSAAPFPAFGMNRPALLLRLLVP
jgi:hypothetical protein